MSGCHDVRISCLVEELPHEDFTTRMSSSEMPPTGRDKLIDF